ncbi:MAG: GGDEF domain-containing protein, partial [Rhizobiales bacterium]|nr:GGDEF domain-containing protein [Hyphomicrobiales bacterium]
SGRAYAKLLPADAATSRFDAVMKTSRRDDGAGVPYQVQYALHPPGADQPLWIEDTGRWFAGADDKPLHVHGVVRVINERHEREQRLTFLSRFDSLTGEINRVSLGEVLEVTIRDTVAQRSSCGFMLVSIDNLGRINEFYGYDVADETINAVAKRLRAKMRGGDHLGRFSGNKFGVILNNCTPEDMERAAGRLIAGVRDDVIRTGAGPVAVTVTVGGVTAPRHASNVPEALARAQEALNRAKARRPGSFQVYRPNVERETLRRRNVQAADEIVTALNQRRILLAFEPVAETSTRQVAFHECLMRIRRVDGSLAPASEVVPVAERFGLVRLLDRRVLELLVAEMTAVPTLRASINVAPVSTTDPDWWSALDALLRTNPGTAERLIVEITESAAIHDLDDTRSFVSRVKDLGCRIAIDDFGSGYTSFRSLRRLGVDILKIDGAFVQNLMQSSDDRAFAQMLIELAKRLGLKTVAEWVQDEASANLLAQWGCDYLQGALIGLASVERPWGIAAPVDRRRTPRV